MEKSPSESVKALSAMAKQTGVWLLGGERFCFVSYSNSMADIWCKQDLSQSEMSRTESYIIRRLCIIPKVKL